MTARTFYTATIDGRRVLLWAALGAGVVAAVLLAVALLPPEHIEAASRKGAKTARFIHGEIGKYAQQHPHSLPAKIQHGAKVFLRNGHDIETGSKAGPLTVYQHKGLYPKNYVPTSPSDLSDALREYLRIYGDFGRGVLRIIRDIGQHRLSGQFPYTPPSAPGPGAGSGVPM